MLMTANFSLHIGTLTVISRRVSAATLNLVTIRTKDDMQTPTNRHNT